VLVPLTDFLQLVARKISQHAGTGGRDCAGRER
jgi:hypothetical protein